VDVLHLAKVGELQVGEEFVEPVLKPANDLMGRLTVLGFIMFRKPILTGFFNQFVIGVSCELGHEVSPVEGNRGKAVVEFSGYFTNAPSPANEVEHLLLSTGESWVRVACYAGFRQILMPGQIVGMAYKTQQLSGMPKFHEMAGCTGFFLMVFA